MSTPALRTKAAQTPFALQPRAPGFVAELEGIDVGAFGSNELVDAIRSAWMRFPVLVFPDLPLNAADLARVASRIGRLGHDPYVEASAEHPNVIEVRREAEETTPIFGQSWHSDWSFQAEPPSGTLLHAQLVPPQGGDTVFANGYAAYEALSPAMRAMLAPLRGLHSARAAYGPCGLFAKDDSSRSMKIVVSADAEHIESHPIVRTHPGSGRKALYINHVYTVGIEGFKPAESRALLGYLFKHMTQSGFRYRHRWQNDMLVLWDNRCVIHYADGGYDGYRRLLYRTTLAGERPV